MPNLWSSPEDGYPDVLFVTSAGNGDATIGELLEQREGLKLSLEERSTPQVV